MEIWHSRQEQIRDSDGSLCVTYPVADLKEKKRGVLKYSSQVEVLSPEELREDVKKEITKIKKNLLIVHYLGEVGWYKKEGLLKYDNRGKIF